MPPSDAPGDRRIPLSQPSGPTFVVYSLGSGPQECDSVSRDSGVERSMTLPQIEVVAKTYRPYEPDFRTINVFRKRHSRALGAPAAIFAIHKAAANSFVRAAPLSRRRRRNDNMLL